MVTPERSPVVTWDRPIGYLHATIAIMRRRLLSPLLLLLVPFAVAQTPTEKPAKPVPTLRSILLEQLRSTHNKAEWFVPVNTAVAGLTPEQAQWIPPEAAGKSGEHSVGQLAHHLVFWDERELAQLRGDKPSAFDGNNDETFDKFDAASWTATVERLDRVMTALEDWVEHADEAKLNAAASIVSHIGTHNAYHTGQILYVRKLQGSWNPANGVK
jgi:uncharacterized damage-inducible protein DinB